MGKIYSFEVSAYGAMTHSEVIAYLVDEEKITKEQAETYEPTTEDIANAIRGGLAYDEIYIKYGDRLFVDFDDNGNFVEVE